MILYSECKSALKCSNILSQTASVFFTSLEKGEKAQIFKLAFKGENNELNLLNS